MTEINSPLTKFEKPMTLKLCLCTSIIGNGFKRYYTCIVTHIFQMGSYREKKKIEDDDLHPGKFDRDLVLGPLVSS